MHTYTVHYLFNDEPRTHQFELKQPELPVHEAALHLLQLHLATAKTVSSCLTRTQRLKKPWSRLRS